MIKFHSIHAVAALVIIATLTAGFHPKCAAAAETGELAVCIASKGDFDNGKPADCEGIRGLAALAHRYGFPVTYYIKPYVAEACKEDLKAWCEQNGDEVGWFSEGCEFGKAELELNRLKAAIPWQPITTTGNIKYGPEWVGFYQKNGINSVWGRCYEQTFVDGITDRGCPPGFYYAMPDCFKAPNPDSGGVISVPWLSNDLNLCFRTAWQPTFTFDPNDTQDIGVTTPGDSSFWEAELAEYQKQTQYNKVVPLVIQQEMHEFNFSDKGHEEWRRDGATILENLFKILKQRGIKVVTVSKAVELYRKAYPERTVPTYAIFGNISSIPIIKSCGLFKLSSDRFTTGTGPSVNGFYACTRIGNIRNYYHPKGISFYDQKRNLTYFDRNGLLIFEEGNPLPIRITSYFDLPPHAYKEKILPELSYWYDTDKYIPEAKIVKSDIPGGFRLKMQASAANNPIFAGSKMPYGIMMWGDYSAYRVPLDAPVGTKVLGRDGLFVPMVLKIGENLQQLDFLAEKQ